MRKAAEKGKPCGRFKVVGKRGDYVGKNVLTLLKYINIGKSEFNHACW